MLKSSEAVKCTDPKTGDFGGFSKDFACVGKWGAFIKVTTDESHISNGSRDLWGGP